MQHQTFVTTQSDKAIDLMHDMRFVRGSAFALAP